MLAFFVGECFGAKDCGRDGTLCLRPPATFQKGNEFFSKGRVGLDHSIAMYLRQRGVGLNSLHRQEYFNHMILLYIG